MGGREANNLRKLLYYIPMVVKNVTLVSIGNSTHGSLLSYHLVCLSMIWALIDF